MFFIKKSKKKIGLVLGAGSAKGWAHIGVINALKELNIEVDIVAGCSIGALVGGAYVTDNIDTFQKWVLNLNFTNITKFFDINFSGSGLFHGKKLFDFLKKEIGPVNFNQTKIPFATVATNINTGEGVSHTKGDLYNAIRASIALPGLLKI